MQDRVRDILAKYGEPVEGNVWKTQGQTVILHKALERIAARAQIVFDPPTVLRAERDEAVLLVTGRMRFTGPQPEGLLPGEVYPLDLTERVEWSIGEALVNVNYRVSGKQAGYVYAMAEKRGKDRVILKLIELHGFAYSEDEADDFRDGKPRLVEPESEPEPALGSIKVNGEQVRMSAYAARRGGLWEPLVASLRACPTIAALEQWTEEHQGDFEALPAGWLEELRQEWKDRAREIKVRG